MVVVSVIAMLFACANVPGVVDQVSWYALLSRHRPELMEQHDGGTDDPAWQALVLRPQYRPELIRSPTLTYEAIVAREYDDAERSADAAWAERMEQAQIAFEPTPTVRPGRFPADVYTSMVIGFPGALRDPRGFSFKVLLEVDDVLEHLGPEQVAGFAEALEAARFVGDFKVDLRPGHTRFQFNNVIIHAPTPEHASCAEATSRRYFAGHLRHVARGVDDMRGESGVDWHHFLLTGGFDVLAADLRAFIEAAGTGTGRCG